MFNDVKNIMELQKKQENRKTGGHPEFDETPQDAHDYFSVKKRQETNPNLDEELKVHVRSSIVRQFHEFRKRVKDKNFEPASLQNRIKLVSSTRQIVPNA